MSKSSEKRIKAFVDEFIRRPEVEALTSDRDCDFVNEPERAKRCYDAVENGADGKLHCEVIQDWRDAFSYWMSDRRRGKWSDCDRFYKAVMNRFTVVEQWHNDNGSLFSEIG